MKCRSKKIRELRILRADYKVFKNNKEKMILIYRCGYISLLFLKTKGDTFKDKVTKKIISLLKKIKKRIEVIKCQ